MANLYVVWNIKERRVEGVFEQNADAVTAKRRIAGKSGGAPASKFKVDAADLEILTATKP